MNNPSTSVERLPNHFSESQWLRILFLLSDTEQWIKQQHENHIYLLPFKNHRKLLRNSWYLSPSALSHIIERHYYKISRHPSTGKFTIGIPTIVSHIRDAFSEVPTAIPQSPHVQRVWSAQDTIGYDRDGTTTNIITVISDQAGRIITAFPGNLICNNQPTNYE
ncbi:hypothetical protein ABDK00_018215 [Niabella insulamsoli]|uniref:hypothetical protein n=1 Tax=Niabella insulamsoli TaxID=3144874 RepID=UPI0031FC1B3A